MKPKMKKKLLTIPQAADRMTVSKKTAWRMLYAGKLEVVRIGRCVRVTDTSVEYVIDEGTIPPANPHTPDDADTYEGEE